MNNNKVFTDYTHLLLRLGLALVLSKLSARDKQVFLNDINGKSRELTAQILGLPSRVYVDQAMSRVYNKIRDLLNELCNQKFKVDVEIEFQFEDI